MEGTPVNGNRYFGVFAVVVVFLSGLCPLSLGMARPEQHSKATRPDTNALCAFITSKMQSALPQVPTLCAPVTEAAGDPLVAPGTLIVSVFSPTNVLEGKMRRAWSTALFQTAQALFFHGALNGACDPNKSLAPAGCELRVSDSSLSQSGLYYKVAFVGTGEVKDLSPVLAGDPASDSFYRQWWQVLEAGTTSRHPDRSSVYAEHFARIACKDFADKVHQYNSSVPNAKDQIPEPSCSAILATNSNVYVAVDYPDILDASMGNNLPWLSDTFGKDFSHTGYDGEVIFRSPWNNDSRVYRMYPLREIEFYWEEVDAGVRDKGHAFVSLATSVEAGVENRQKLFDEPDKGVSRLASVVKITPVAAPNFELVDLTDGSEWSFPASASPGCKLTPGTTVWEMAGSAKNPPVGQALLGSRVCNESMRGTFVQGW
jgi:hypothetical protein